jgi:hypothetical protein
MENITKITDACLPDIKDIRLKNIQEIKNRTSRFFQRRIRSNSRESNNKY